jgi:hypothetical protein
VGFTPIPLVAPEVAPILGQWDRRDAAIVIARDGRALVKWRRQDVDSNALQMSGRAAISFRQYTYAPDQILLYGEVGETNQPRTVALGSTWVTLYLASDRILIEQPDRDVLWFCHGESVNYCGPP